MAHRQSKLPMPWMQPKAQHMCTKKKQLLTNSLATPANIKVQSRTRYATCIGLFIEALVKYFRENADNIDVRRPLPANLLPWPLAEFAESGRLNHSVELLITRR